MELCYEYRGRLIEPDFGAQSEVRLSALMRHMQQAGSDQLASLGATYDSMKAGGGVFLMSRHEMHITGRPIVPGDVSVTTWPRHKGGALFFRHYSLCQKGRLLAECSTAWVLVDPQTRRILRPSSCPIRPMHCDRAVSFGDPRRLSLPDTPLPLGSLRVGYSLLDVNGHVNNTVYADFLLDCVKRLCPGARMTGQAIAFCGEAVEGDELSLDAAADGPRLYVRGKIKDRRCFEATAFLERR